MAFSKYVRRAKLKYGSGYSKRRSNQQQYYNKIKRRRFTKKVALFTLPGLAMIGVGIFVAYKFLRKS